MWPTIGSIPTYDVFYASAIVIHGLLALWYCRKFKLTWRIAAGLALSFLFSMAVGAHLLWEATHGIWGPINLEYFVGSGLWGGLAVHLAISVPVLFFATKANRAAMDTLALSLPAPLILSKIACFTNGCCHGRECHFPWAVTYPEGGIAPPGLPLHPTQLYEILVLVVLGGTLWTLNRPRWRGSLILWFLVIYGLGRPLTEIYRGDLDLRPALGPLSTSQAACLAGATICVGLLLLLRRRLSAEHCGPVSSLDEL